MNNLFRRIRLHYHILEIYTIIFLSPIAFFIFLTLISVQKENINKKIKNSSYLLTEINDSNKNSNEWLSYELKENNLLIEYHLKNSNFNFEAKEKNKITKLDDENYQICVDLNFNKNQFKNTLSKKFLYKNIDKNKNIKLHFIKKIKGLSVFNTSINLDFNKSQKKIFMYKENEVINNLKSFFPIEIVRL